MSLVRLFNRIQKYQGVNTLDLLKVLAVISMVVDHLGFYLYGNGEIWRTFGRLAAPIFFFSAGFVSRPQRPNFDRPFYRSLGKLLLLSVPLTFLHYLIWETVQLNMLFPLLLAKLLLHFWDPSKSKPWIVLGFCILALVIHDPLRAYLQYGTLGLSYAVSGRLLAAGRQCWLARLLLVGTIAFQFSYYAPYKQEFLLLVGVGVVLALILMTFRLHHFSGFKEKHPFPSYTLLLGSRYTLEIYVLHLAGLQLLYLSWIYDY